MSFWTAMVIIAAIWGLVSIIRGRPDASSPGLGFNDEGRPIGTGPAEGDLRAEIARLRERLEVLERITTEAESSLVRDRRRLEAEIDSLRERE